MKLDICLVVLSYYLKKFHKDLLENLWRFCNLNFGKWKTRKSSLVSMSSQENLRIYFWDSLPDLKHDQKHFISISSLHIPEMRPLSAFSQFYQLVTMETMTVKNLELQF